MLKKILFRTSPVLAAGFLPLDWYDHDKVTKVKPVYVSVDLLLYSPSIQVQKDIKTSRDFYLNKNDTETGSDRLYRMFTIEQVSQHCLDPIFKNLFFFSEFGRVSSEANAIYQAGFLGLFAGAVYGGFLHSRTAYFNFMDRNQATAFKSHLDAKVLN